MPAPRAEDGIGNQFSTHDDSLRVRYQGRRESPLPSAPESLRDRERNLLHEQIYQHNIPSRKRR